MSHLIATRVAGTALIAAGGMAVLPAVLVGILNLIGFGAGGVAAGESSVSTKS